MSRAKLFNMIKSRGTQENGRNPFDLSNMHAYSEKCMKINPVKVIDTLPKDYFDIDVSTFMQSNGPLNTAAFIRGRHELSAYYIPYNSIWHNFNQYQATREDPDSAVLQAKGIAYEPRFAIWCLYKTALAYFCQFVYDWYYKPLFDETFRSCVTDSSYYQSKAMYLALSRARDVAMNTELPSENYYAINAWANSSAFWPYLTSTEYKWYTYDLNHHGENSLTSRDLFYDVNGQPAWCDVLRKLDMLGYGNLYVYFKPYANLIEQYFLGVLSTAATAGSEADWDTLISDFEGDILIELTALMNSLKRISSASALTLISGTTSQYYGTYEYVNVYPLFAYNRCFYDMFRNSYYDNDYNVRNYNCDFVGGDSLANSTIWYIDLPSRFWRLESHQYEKDMFTGILPDTQFGAVSGVNLSNITINATASLNGHTGSDYGHWIQHDGSSIANGKSVVTQNGGFLQYSDDGYKGLKHDHTVVGTASFSGSASALNAFDALALRRAECLQQYRMDLLRAGNKTRDIFKQIYGSNPKSELDEAPYFIDVTGSDINVNPIIATADTQQGDNGSLGDVAGRALVNENGSFKFSTEDFGCILFLSYTVVRSMYNSYRINPHRMNLDPESHFIPQLMNLGFEPVTRDWMCNLKASNVRHSVVGYSLPYLEFKTDIDECHGNFVDAIDPDYDPYRDGSLLQGIMEYLGPNSIWVAARTDMQLDDFTRLRHFYGDPRVLDNVMKVQAGFDYESDQFICHTALNVKSVRQLSELGLPRF